MGFKDISNLLPFIPLQSIISPDLITHLHLLIVIPLINSPICSTQGRYLRLDHFKLVFTKVFLFYRKLSGRTIFVTGASRGIGKAIALKAARDGANVVIAAKTAEPHPKLPGTIYTAAKESKQFCLA